MGRKVFITSDMSSDEKLIEVAEQNSEAALLWPWFLTAFDDWARAEASPKKLKIKVFPMLPHVTVQLIEDALRLFDLVNLICLYVVDGKQYMAYPDYFDLQKPQYVRPSKFPDPPPLNKDIKIYLDKCHNWPVRPETPWLKYRTQVFKRDGYRCVYCGTYEGIGLDHVIPRSRGGADTPDNLVTSCFPCNRRKSNRTPQEAGMVICRG